MSLTKVNYIDNSTIITAKNLNDIQDNIIQNAELIKKAAPKNLLDNSDFTNPINQRGFVSGTEVAAGKYFIDRWRVEWIIPQNPILNKNGFNGLTSSNIEQVVDLSKYIGKPITIALYEEYNKPICCASGIVVQTTDWTAFAYPQNWECRVCSSNNIWVVGVQAACKYVALYPGEYTMDTLPEYQPKGYGAELAECRRYFRPSVIYNMICHYPGYLIGAHLEVPMRINPTITVTSTHTGKWEEVSGTTAANPGNGGISTVENTNFTVGNWYRVGLELNADF